MYQYSTTKIVFIQNNVKKHWNICGGGGPFQITPMQHKSFKKFFCGIIAADYSYQSQRGGGSTLSLLYLLRLWFCVTPWHITTVSCMGGGTLEARVTKDRIPPFLRQVGLPSAVPPTRLQLPIQGLTNNSVPNGQRHAKSSPPLLIF